MNMEASRFSALLLSSTHKSKYSAYIRSALFSKFLTKLIHFMTYGKRNLPVTLHLNNINPDVCLTVGCLKRIGRYSAQRFQFCEQSSGFVA